MQKERNSNRSSVTLDDHEMELLFGFFSSETSCDRCEKDIEVGDSYFYGEELFLCEKCKKKKEFVETI